MFEGQGGSCFDLWAAVMGGRVGLSFERFDAEKLFVEEMETMDELCLWYGCQCYGLNR